MSQPTRRKHQRCAEDAAITYTFLNKTEPYQATARNRSRFGLYFETRKSVAPGTLIVIRRVNAKAEESRKSGRILKRMASRQHARS